ncbi:MAG: anthranilate synthase component I family protein [Bacillota bacterium]
MDLKLYKKVYDLEEFNSVETYKNYVKGNLGFIYENEEYIYIGKSNNKYFRSKGNFIEVNLKNKKHYKNKNPFEILKKQLKFFNQKNNKSKHFTGGLIGNIGYEMIHYIEKIKTNNKRNINLPDIDLLFIKDLIVYSKKEKKIYLYINSYEESENIEKKFQNMKDSISKRKIKDIEIQLSDLKTNTSKKEFCKKVKKAKDYIEKGDIFQVVLSQRISFKTEAKGLEIFHKLNKKDNPYKYFFKLKDYDLVGVSPEILIKNNGGEISTVPIAGTIKKSNDLEENKKLKKKLLNDPKEKSEHLMLVDLARNDLGKVSKIGSVKVKEFMQLKSFSHVTHITSLVTGDLKSENVLALKSMLPAGTLSGAPKIRAMEIIEELEDTKRELYGGTVGYFGFNNQMEQLIHIRTLILKKNKGYLQVGAGIVKDSKGKKEYYETINKSKSILNIFGGDAFDLINR